MKQKVGFYISWMDFRGIVNSTYEFAFYNQKILKNKSIIFYLKSEKSHKKEIVNKFKKNFKTIGLNKFEDILRHNINSLYIQKSGNKDNFYFKEKNTLVHAVFPCAPSNVHGNSYAYISEWLSKTCSNYKIPYVPYIIELDKTNKNLRKKYKIKNYNLVFGYHGGKDSFNLNFVQEAVVEIVKKRKDIFFIFLNVNQFAKHQNLIFLKGTFDKNLKTQFINTCDAMIHARILGESFGISCAEFALKNKPILTYAFSRHRAHFSLLKNDLIIYSSKKNLKDIIYNFDRQSFYNLKTSNIIKRFNAKNVIKIFEKIYLKRLHFNKLTKFDYLKIFYFKILDVYFYIRHKINNYFQ
tara:strand:- start:688 stop:1746 length:1059 start_codon:yes stop_codon:yes gene_type:complete